MDKDILYDVDSYQWDTYKVVYDLVCWFVRQTHMIIRRKHMSLYEKKPGAVAGTSGTKIIFVRMLCRQGNFNPNSKIANILALRAKYNDALNDAVAKIDQYMLTINSCNQYDHFDQWGNLSPKGKCAFWEELDNLIYRFDNGKVKLLPNPKVPRAKQPSKLIHGSCAWNNQ